MLTILAFICLKEMHGKCEIPTLIWFTAYLIPLATVIDLVLLQFIIIV